MKKSEENEESEDLREIPSESKGIPLEILERSKGSLSRI